MSLLSSRHGLAYHAALFGYENIYVLDNGSSHLDFIKCLDSARNKGVNIKSNPDVSAFLNKGEYLVDWARSIGLGKEGDGFLLFLDADEFICVDRIHTSASTFHESLMLEFERIAHSRASVFRINKGYANIPGSQYSYLISGNGAQKVVVRQSAMQGFSLDHGYHCYNWSTGMDSAGSLYVEHTDLCFLHFNNKPWEQFKQAALSKLSPFVDTDDRVALADFNGPGVHLVRPLLGGVDEYCDYIKSKTTETRINHLKLLTEISNVVPPY
jgi:hypothetical protein